MPGGSPPPPGRAPAQRGRHLGAQEATCSSSRRRWTPTAMALVMLNLEWKPFDGGVTRSANSILHNANAVSRMRQNLQSVIRFGRTPGSPSRRPASESTSRPRPSPRPRRICGRPRSASKTAPPSIPKSSTPRPSAPSRTTTTTTPSTTPCSPRSSSSEPWARSEAEFSCSFRLSRPHARLDPHFRCQAVSGALLHGSRRMMVTAV